MAPTPDLHTHSTASDGTLTPGDLIRRAAARGVAVLALTDHDTTEGLAAARSAALDAEVRLIPGVEISVTWGGRTVHIVGLNLDPDEPTLQAGLARLRDYRVWRAAEIGRRLERAGIPGALDGARALSNGRLIGRTHFARFLVHQGLAREVAEVFKRYLTHGKPGHVAGQWASLEEATGWIRAAGGQAVLAHPARYDLTRTRLIRLCDEFRALGGTGLEVISGSHRPDDAQNMARLARAQGLLASAGSDYHGPEQPWLELGRLPPLPDGCTPIWHDWPAASHAPAVPIPDPGP